MPRLHPQTGDRPDVIYVILDGYGRSDTLRASYDLENRTFLDQHRRRGFYVADQPMSNYGRKLLSLASSLNMDYLDRIRAQSTGEGKGPIGLLQRTRVFEEFRDRGYTIVASATGNVPTAIRDAEVFLMPPGSQRTALLEPGPTAFEGLLLQTTMAKALLELKPDLLQAELPVLIANEYSNHRQRILLAISNLSDVAAEPGDHFLFAHVVAPDPPFVFGPQGQRLIHTEPYSLTEIGCCERDVYVSSYRDQVEYVDQLLRLEIDELLEASDVAPIIILQGDHGPGGHLESGSASTLGCKRAWPS
jgi:hypothetical protein